ncbi:helix-turn-helix transcriptional regulator [Bacillus sp. FJAT-42315]|uniref:helix-turn-helix transcriptional regulator n=1 Tax=Bacillus sp. FJAT-42315 TaxID=2014077 RepID=UPI000C239C35|nr:YafY family protein [Bacillus sp. FJAT-42315]
MKVERLLTMIMILINRKKVKAQELADLFDVSVRTIYRDVDTLSCAGIPVTSQQGSNGGISLMEGYRIDQQVLTKDELASLSVAIQSALTSYEDPHAEAVLEKLTGVADETVRQSVDQVFIDLSPWGQNVVLKEQLTLLKQAIESTHCVRFNYVASDGSITSRLIEPHTLVQKGRIWYVYGYCRLRESFRLFKIARMKDIVEEEELFEKKPLQLADLPWDKEWQQPQNLVHLTLSFDPKIVATMEEMFGIEHVDVERSIVEVSLPENEWLYGYLLSFGHRIKVMEPYHISQIVRERAEKIVALYKEKSH